MKFTCPHCQQHFEAESPQAGVQIPCPSCGQSLDLAAAAAPVETAAPAPRRRSRFGLVVGLALVAVVGAALAVVLADKPQEGKPASSLAKVREKVNALWLGWFPEAPATLSVFPTNVVLNNGRDRQGIVVQASYADGSTRDVTAAANLSLADAKPARIDQATLLPVADGSSTLKVRYAGRAVDVPVTVQQATNVPPISFVLDIMPVLSKAGCNSGGCHGTSRGKDGFHLSLFGYDPEGDYFRLTREFIGRRLNLAVPEDSLLLQKGAGLVPHTGGERFKTNSPLYSTILAWIRDGAKKDSTNIARAVRVEILPQQAVLIGAGSKQKFTVRAHYADGSDRDVTSLAVFLSNNDVSAKVSDDGFVTAGPRGEAYVTARFEEFTVGSQVVVSPPAAGFVFPEITANNYVDDLVLEKLKKLRVIPSEVCDDATFIRRASIDIIGLLPTADEVRAFAASTDPKKRDQLVDKLIAREEFADRWVMKFAELLAIRSRNDEVSTKAALTYFDWLRERMLTNQQMDRVVRDLLTAKGGSLSEPAVNYYQIERDTLKISENVAQVFMGMRIQCAQCHNHPFDRWTMNDYYGFAAFFPQVGRKQGEDPRETIVFDKPDGEVKHPVGGKTVKPKFLGGDVPEIAKGESRRQVLADWMASPKNPFFARNLANIVWAHFLGRGIIDPVDDIRVSNPAVNPELLDTLGKKFTDYEYDFRKLVRDITTSRTYQLSTRPNESNAHDDRNFARAAIRRMRAEVLLDSINQVAETPDKYQGLARGARAVQIADGNVANYFLTTFGRATRTTVCSCEVKTEPNLSQALHLLNGSATNDKLQNSPVVKRLLKDLKEPSRVIDELYMRCLGRVASEDERTKLLAFVDKAKTKEAGLQDVFWSLLNSKEFLFNH